MPLPWFDDDAEPRADMWATPAESRQQIVELYHHSWRHSDDTIEQLPLDAVGSVPWWPAEHREVSLHLVLVHMAVETHRHAGHADILRESIDGATGFRKDNAGTPDAGETYWLDYRQRLEAAARAATG